MTLNDRVFKCWYEHWFNQLSWVSIKNKSPENAYQMVTTTYNWNHIAQNMKEQVF